MSAPDTSLIVWRDPATDPPQDGRRKLVTCLIEGGHFVATAFPKLCGGARTGWFEGFDDDGNHVRALAHVVLRWADWPESWGRRTTRPINDDDRIDELAEGVAHTGDPADREALIAACADLAERRAWKDASEPPRDDRRVLVESPISGSVYVGYRSLKTKSWHNDRGYRIDVRRWRELPIPPPEEA